MGTMLIVWTIRLSLICFFTTLLGWAIRRDATWERRLSIVWTLGFVLFLTHVLSAFHFHHHWSHQAAVAETGRQTKELLGVEFGAGVYFNYLFLAVWAGDVAWIWSASPDGKRAYRWLESIGLAYLLFIAFNGTAVFKTGWLRGIGIVATLVLFVGLCQRIARTR